MTDCLDRFFDAEMGKATHELMLRADRNDVPRLLIALTDPLPSRRGAAVHALGSQHQDVRIIEPLIDVLNNKQEMPCVRTQAAECLALHASRKVANALIANSTDECEDVRFWCVFALGQIRQGNPHKLHPRLPWRKMRRALVERLHDQGDPQQAVAGWTVHLEALAALAGKDSADPPTRLFRQTMDRAVMDPINHPKLWRWVEAYATGRELKQRMAVVKELATRVLKDPLAHREYWPWAEKYYMTRKGRHLYYEAGGSSRPPRLIPPNSARGRRIDKCDFFPS